MLSFSTLHIRNHPKKKKITEFIDYQTKNNTTQPNTRNHIRFRKLTQKKIWGTNPERWTLAWQTQEISLSWSYGERWQIREGGMLAWRRRRGGRGNAWRRSGWVRVRPWGWVRVSAWGGRRPCGGWDRETVIMMDWGRRWLWLWGWMRMRMGAWVCFYEGKALWGRRAATEQMRG